MNTSNSKSRRQFLRNTTLTVLAAGILPQLSKTARAASASQDCNPTTLDYYGQGPFYKPNAPLLTDNKLAADNETGTRLILSGVVRTLDCSMFIPDTLIDIWHANDAGAYDNSGFNLRGITYSNAQGFYLFETILPGKYLNGSTYRPSHIHFKITPPGFPSLITQLYFENDTDIPADAAASITSGTYDATHRIIPVTMNGQGKYEGTWDIIVDGVGTTGIHDAHLNQGMIYSVSPNPFTNRVEINYGVFKQAKVSICVYNMNGSLVATLDEHHLSPQKYRAVWQPQTDLPNGIYFISLKINDMQTHYLKTMKM
jgi:protocatechuate 3,4-dioxygenase beta subunit